MDWGSAIRRAVKRHVEKAIQRIDPDRYSQEYAYVAALLSRLDGVVYQGVAGRVEIRSTIVADRGPKSAESQWCGDFAVVASLRSPIQKVEKGILAPGLSTTPSGRMVSATAINGTHKLFARGKRVSKNLQAVKFQFVYG